MLALARTTRLENKEARKEGGPKIHDPRVIWGAATSVGAVQLEGAPKRGKLA